VVLCYRTLQPREKLLYAWENPTGSHSVVWNAGKKKEITDELRKVNSFTYFLMVPSNRDEKFWILSIYQYFKSCQFLCFLDILLTVRNFTTGHIYFVISNVG
jgi:hypothetical protein